MYEYVYGKIIMKPTLSYRKYTSNFYRTRITDEENGWFYEITLCQSPERFRFPSLVWRVDSVTDFLYSHSSQEADIRKSTLGQSCVSPSTCPFEAPSQGYRCWNVLQ